MKVFRPIFYSGVDMSPLKSNKIGTENALKDLASTITRQTHALREPVHLFARKTFQKRCNTLRGLLVCLVVQVKQCRDINIQSFLSNQYKICFLCSVRYMNYLLQFLYSKAI